MLENITSPKDIKKLSIPELESLCSDIRKTLIDTVSKTGGHLASSLGAVEMIVALHYVYDMPEDKLIFDVGHQTYAHKILTGRRDAFSTLRQKDGISGFPNIAESDYDLFTTGHASDSISLALGMARTRDLMGERYHVISVVGDGALTGGMCYEALNDCGQSQTPLIVVLNDNRMSIAENVGAMSRHLTNMRQSNAYRNLKKSVRKSLDRVPVIGSPTVHVFERMLDTFKTMLLDDRFFNALGFEYYGPIDGHNLKELTDVFRRAKNADKPLLLHVVTQKGRGYAPAEAHPEIFHGIGPFNVETGKPLVKEKEISNSRVMADELCKMAETDFRVCAISAAMPSGTGLDIFKEKFPDRFFDVGIAEEHAVSMAAGMAAAGMKPYVAIYSTFMQRAYDQIMTDVCLNDLPVTFLLDRGGLVGADGVTHQGVFDLSYLRTIPNMTIAAPRDIRELRRMLRFSKDHNGPMAIRYPKAGEFMGESMSDKEELRLGSWEMLADGKQVMIFACGRMVQTALSAAITLMSRNVSCGVIDARFLKPVDEEMILETVRRGLIPVTLEDNTEIGGLGDAVSMTLSAHGIKSSVLRLGVPDRFIEHGTIDQQSQLCGIDFESVAARILERLKENG